MRNAKSILCGLLLIYGLFVFSAIPDYAFADDLKSKNQQYSAERKERGGEREDDNPTKELGEGLGVLAAWLTAGAAVLYPLRRLTRLNSTVSATTSNEVNESNSSTSTASLPRGSETHNTASLGSQVNLSTSMTQKATRFLARIHKVIGLAAIVSILSHGIAMYIGEGHFEDKFILGIIASVVMFVGALGGIAQIIRLQSPVFAKRMHVSLVLIGCMLSIGHIMTA
ncbi:ferric reductase-like transmembrane domain-containing protein [Heliobacterium chlorum]|uniref:Ferric reductase-like transmembrane domain-containing protein n=1 Tax=Heliobacterium chlorum TaxID=2698 RepID=A0ABR7T7W6_HELCL|nr:ferric reductase-like transmembrane domain-containing protein [Heliobacterium chlorum]MBC9786465.1 ferric reductase-like transmembrane domain-containing protein [Heliobacterium chlorum]